MAFDQISPLWYHGIGRSRWLKGWRGLALLAAAVAAVAIGVGWNWLAGIGALSILVTALPCLAMCALGLCMERAVGRGNRRDSSGAKSGELPKSEMPCCGETASELPPPLAKGP